MKGRWILVADSTRARIFLTKTINGKLHEIETLVHPEGRLHTQELTSDLPGRSFDSEGEGRHALGREHDPKQQEAIYFSKTIATRLNRAQKSGELKSLFIVAPPGMLGLLRDHLNKQTKALVVGELDKNLAKLKPGELLDHLPKPHLPMST
ncbi:MAG: host attachment protein [Gammaproteobacteria bacterium]|nr:MAG: host attachment protein [Gammaproteobacteria bacterium]